MEKSWEIWHVGLHLEVYDPTDTRNLALAVILAKSAFGIAVSLWDRVLFLGWLV